MDKNWSIVQNFAKDRFAKLKCCTTQASKNTTTMSGGRDIEHGQHIWQLNENAVLIMVEISYSVHPHTSSGDSKDWTDNIITHKNYCRSEWIHLKHQKNWKDLCLHFTNNSMQLKLWNHGAVCWSKWPDMVCLAGCFLLTLNCMNSVLKHVSPCMPKYIKNKENCLYKGLFYYRHPQVPLNLELVVSSSLKTLCNVSFVKYYKN